MRDLRERVESLKKRRRSVQPDELHKLLTAAGFDFRQGKGDHLVYTHPSRRFPLTIDPRKPLLPAYVTKAIRAIEEVLPDDSEEQDEPDDQEP